MVELLAKLDKYCHVHLYGRIINCEVALMLMLN